MKLTPQVDNEDDPPLQESANVVIMKGGRSLKLLSKQASRPLCFLALQSRFRAITFTIPTSRKLKKHFAAMLPCSCYRT
jgi:hypothetical protein